jgi:hypothetical protein
VIDPFESRLSKELHRVALPVAPESLRVRVRDVTAKPLGNRSRPNRGRGGFRWVGLVAVVAIVLGAGAAFLLSAGNEATLPTPSPAGSSRPVITVSPSAAAPSLPTTVDGKPVLSVSEAIAKRDKGEVGAAPVAIRGFWSYNAIAHSCAPPPEQTGELEIYCVDREFGITELDEPIEVIPEHGTVTVGVGPWLTPYVGQDAIGAIELFNLPVINGQRFPPVPIVVVGHFDDPRASQCRVAARELCRDRLVLDRVVAFPVDAVPTPAPTAPPTPFPAADPPPAPYDIKTCAEGHPVKFAGWTMLASLGIELGRPDETAYIVITRDPIPIGDWFNDPNDHTTYRLWGQRVCYGYEDFIGAVEFTAMPGTEFREYRDGRREPTQGP